jgi:hypothetical protein
MAKFPTVRTINKESFEWSKSHIKRWSKSLTLHSSKDEEDLWAFHHKCSFGVWSTVSTGHCLYCTLDKALIRRSIKQRSFTYQFFHNIKQRSFPLMLVRHLTDTCNT